MEKDVSLTAYTQARDKRPEGRGLLVVSKGSDGDIDGNVQSVFSQINTFANNDLSSVGQVCILGRSNGCSLALGIAARLQSADVRLTFVGVSDVTMFPSGRNPPVNLIGDLQPSTDPTTTAAKTPNAVQKKFGSFQQPAPVGAIPTIKLKTKITASEGTVNHFQIAGNHMKYAPSVGRWIWFSDMADGEVHGIIDSFDVNNGFLDVVGKTDLDLHINVNTEDHWRALASAASTALAKIP